MASLLKNTASQHIGFVLTNVSTGAPVTAGGAGNVVIDGGAQAACAGTFTHKGSGQWDYAPTQAETNGTAISFAFTGTSAIQIGMLFYTDQVDANGLLKVDTEDWKGGVIPAPNVTGEPLVDLNHIAGAALSTHAAGMVPSDLRDIVGVAVSTTTAQLGVNVVQYNAQTAQTDANNLPKVDTEDWKGGIVPAPNVAGEPLVDVNHWRGTQPAILDANAMVKADVEDVGGVVLSTHTAGMLPGDTRNWVGTTIAAPSTSGVPDVNVKNFNNVAAVSLPANFNLMSISAAGAVAITSATKKNQALNGFMFTMTDSTTHGPKPGLGVGITAQRSLDGGAFAGTVSNPTELSNGVYILNLAAGDMNGNNVMLRLTAAASDDLNILLITQP